MAKFEIKNLWWITLSTLAAAGCDRQDNAPRPGAERQTGALQQTAATPPEATGHAVLESPTASAAAAGAPTPTTPSSAATEAAEADLEAAPGQKIDGDVKFSSAATGVTLIAEIEDASPGKHGIHIHEKGDCSDIPGKSMGDHFAPDKHAHGLPSEGNTRHLGDLGNIEVGADGKGRLEATIAMANLKKDDPKSLLGKSIVIHASEDKGKAQQPSGGSGDPIACGVIEAD